MSGTATVVVSAAYVTFCDFDFKIRPAAVAYEATDCHPLGRPITMVKVEDQYVRLATIDARMLEQVFDEAAKVLCDVSRAVAVSVGDVGGLIALVMSAVPLRMAHTAITVKLALRLVLEREFR